MCPTLLLSHNLFYEEITLSETNTQDKHKVCGLFCVNIPKLYDKYLNYIGIFVEFLKHLFYFDSIGSTILNINIIDLHTKYI